MITLTCQSCEIEFKGRPNRRYCSVECRRKAEIAERQRKKAEEYQKWLDSLPPEQRKAWESIPELNINDLVTPGQQWNFPEANWENLPDVKDAWGDLPTSWDGMEEKSDNKKRRK
jgi:hypothetical protein